MGDTTGPDVDDRDVGRGLKAPARARQDSEGEPRWCRPAEFPPPLHDRGRFVETYARLVYAAIERTLRRLGVKRDVDLAEDLFAGVFVAMFDHDARRLRQWDGRCSLETWLTLIASSVARDHLRSERRFEARLDRTIHDVERVSQARASDVVENTHDRDEQDERIERLRTALGDLAEGDRRLIEALYVEDRLPSEVARELGLAMGALYTRKSRALERLRAVMGRQRDD